MKNGTDFQGKTVIFTTIGTVFQNFKRMYLLWLTDQMVKQNWGNVLIVLETFINEIKNCGQIKKYKFWQELVKLLRVPNNDRNERGFSCSAAIYSNGCVTRFLAIISWKSLMRTWLKTVFWCTKICELETLENKYIREKLVVVPKGPRKIQVLQTLQLCTDWVGTEGEIAILVKEIAKSRLENRMKVQKLHQGAFRKWKQWKHIS